MGGRRALAWRDRIVRRPHHVALLALCAGLASAPAGTRIGLLVAPAVAAGPLLLGARGLALLAALLALAGAEAGGLRTAAIDRAAAVRAPRPPGRGPGG